MEKNRCGTHDTLVAMKRALPSVVITIVAALIAGVLVGRYVFPAKIIVRETVARNEAAESSVHLMLSYGNGIVRTWNTVTIGESTSVLDLLKLVAATGAIALRTQSTQGKLQLVGIDAIANNPSEGRRWIYWVNNIEEPRAIDKYYLRPGDIVVVAYTKE